MRREMEEKNILPEQTVGLEGRFAQFQEYTGKWCTSLSDLDGAEVKAFWDMLRGDCVVPLGMIERMQC
jgi:hypothetical protein